MSSIPKIENRKDYKTFELKSSQNDDIIICILIYRIMGIIIFMYFMCIFRKADKIRE